MLQLAIVAVCVLFAAILLTEYKNKIEQETEKRVREDLAVIFDEEISKYKTSIKQSIREGDDAKNIAWAAKATKLLISARQVVLNRRLRTK